MNDTNRSLNVLGSRLMSRFNHCALLKHSGDEACRIPCNQQNSPKTSHEHLGTYGFICNR